MKINEAISWNNPGLTRRSHSNWHNSGGKNQNHQNPPIDTRHHVSDTVEIVPKVIVGVF
jgi:hypothetical protein